MLDCLLEILEENIRTYLCFDVKFLCVLYVCFIMYLLV